MTNNTKTKQEFREELIRIESLGIECDRQKVKRNMCAQFANPREWAREYAVNSSDALATECLFSGFEKDGMITIVVEDNGKGMNRERVEDFFTLYRSKKEIPADQAVGRHGIGKLSVAAIPGQTGFEMITSTGEECWTAVTGSLLDEVPIRISRIEPVPPAGTKFRITFKKSVSLKKELELLKEVLDQYVPFLKCMLFIEIPDKEDDPEKRNVFTVNREWPGIQVQAYRDFIEQISGSTFRITLGLGKQQQVIYQNRVCITGKYNLISWDMSEKWDIPNLSILVDSSDFELPFGRHCLSNEDILKPLAHRIRCKLLPEFYKEIYQMYKSGILREYNISDYSFELLTSNLLLYDQEMRGPWYDTPVFRMVTKKLVSMNELSDMAHKAGKIYLASDHNAGIDFSVFDGPVMNAEQYGCCGEVIKSRFGSLLIDLGKSSLVMEQPVQNRNQFSDIELNFERNLGFHPDLYRVLRQTDKNDDSGIGSLLSPVNSFKDLSEQIISRESRNAKQELENIRWRINRLVQRDGVTPCINHLFLFTGDEVVLNLNHPDIVKLVSLSSRNQGLAAHWAMALSLLDEQNILPHITPSTREDLLMLDALVRIGKKQGADYHNMPDMNNRWRELLRRLNEFDLN